MNKKFLFLSLIAILSFFTGIIFFMPTDTSGLPILNNEEYQTSGFAVYTEDGDIIYTNSIESIRKSIFGSTMVTTDSQTLNNPIGIVENPPTQSIISIKDMALKSLDNDNKVLIIYIDGLGYDLYKKAIDLGIIPCLESTGIAEKALTVYPTITDVTFAAMVTGTTPKYTGIHNREKKPLEIPTIFDKAAEMGKTSKVIEGNIKIIIDEVETILNIDENNNGTIDDEIYNKALEELKNPPDVLLVHFHSYDDFGHKYGPNSDEALAQLSILDSYIKNMLHNYDGDVIITSDHGMHDEGGGGAHGSFSESDLFIPIWTLFLKNTD